MHLVFDALRNCARFTVLCAAIAVSGCAANISPEAYMRLTEDLLSKGHLRVDSAPKDAPIDSVGLARSFRDVTFSYEFHFDGDEIVNEAIEKPLKRWRGVIRYKLIGDGVSPADEAEVAELTRKIGDLTGLWFLQTEDAHDMLISIAGPQGRAQISRYLGDRGMPVYRQRYDIWQRTPDWMCGATLSASNSDPGRLVFAHIFLRSEVSGLLRTACLQEEIVQSLGLTNDSPDARPSIFNDDQEFAVMTQHDELLLRALYDPRLRTGMTADQAMPIAERIFDDLSLTES